MWKRFCELVRRIKTIGSRKPVSVVKGSSWDDILEESVSFVYSGRSCQRGMLLPQSTVLVSEDVENVSSKRKISAGINVLFSFYFDGRSYQINIKRPPYDPLRESCHKIKTKMVKAVASANGYTKPTSEGWRQIEQKLKFEFDGVTEGQTYKPISSLVSDDSHEFSKILVNGIPFRLAENKTSVTSVSCNLSPMVGSIVIPAVDLVNGDCEMPSLQWFVCDVIEPIVETTSDKNAKGKKKKPRSEPLVIRFADEKCRDFEVVGYSFRSKGLLFRPSVEDLNRKIAVVADAGANSPVIGATAYSPIQKGPEVLITDSQVEWCRQNTVADGNIRVMSYNVLADLYLNLALAQEDLFFNYCPKNFQAYVYRFPLVLKQLQDLRSDIVFLQEVDHRMQLRYCKPLFTTANFGFEFAKKRQQVNEGSAIAYDKNKFELVWAKDFGLAELLDEPTNEDVRRILKTSPEQSEKIFMFRPTIIQAVMLRDRETNNLLLCGNTHLHHSPKDEQIKALQAFVAVRKLLDLREASLTRENSVHLLFAGDFNSVPTGPVFELLSTGRLKSDAACWKLDSELIAEDLELPGNVALKCLSGVHRYTNYTKNGDHGFEGCLDYIWSADLSAEQVCPMPSHEVCTQHCALPSEISPSDHLPIICDVRLR